MFVVFDSSRVQKSQTIFKKMINMIYSVCFPEKKSKQKFPKNKNKKPDPSTKTPKFQRIPRGPNGSKGSENVFTRCDYASNFSARDQLQYFRTLDLSERVQALQRLLLSGAAGTFGGWRVAMGCWWWFFRCFACLIAGLMLVVRKHQLNPLKFKK